MVADTTFWGRFEPCSNNAGPTHVEASSGPRSDLMGGSLSRAPGDHFFLPIEGVDFEVVAPSNTAIVDPPTEGAGAGGSSSAVYPIKNLQRCEGYFLAQGGEEIHKVLMPVKFPLFKRLKREKAVARALGVTDRGALPKHVTYENDHMELGRDGCLRIEADFYPIEPSS